MEKVLKRYGSEKTEKEHYANNGGCPFTLENEHLFFLSSLTLYFWLQSSTTKENYHLFIPPATHTHTRFKQVTPCHSVISVACFLSKHPKAILGGRRVSWGEPILSLLDTLMGQWQALLLLS